MDIKCVNYFVDHAIPFFQDKYSLLINTRNKTITSLFFAIIGTVALLSVCYYLILRDPKVTKNPANDNAADVDKLKNKIMPPPIMVGFDPNKAIDEEGPTNNDSKEDLGSTDTDSKSDESKPEETNKEGPTNTDSKVLGSTDSGSKSEETNKEDPTNTGPKIEEIKEDPTNTDSKVLGSTDSGSKSEETNKEDPTNTGPKIEEIKEDPTNTDSKVLGSTDSGSKSEETNKEDPTNTGPKIEEIKEDPTNTDSKVLGSTDSGSKSEETNKEDPTNTDPKKEIKKEDPTNPDSKHLGSTDTGSKSEESKIDPTVGSKEIKENTFQEGKKIGKPDNASPDNAAKIRRQRCGSCEEMKKYFESHLLEKDLDPKFIELTAQAYAQKIVTRDQDKLKRDLTRIYFRLTVELKAVSKEEGKKQTEKAINDFSIALNNYAEGIGIDKPQPTTVTSTEV